MTELPVGAAKARASHVWNRHEDDWYVEPSWVSERLFDVEVFTGTLWDPAVGMGRILAAAWQRGLPVQTIGTDIVDREYHGRYLDFLSTDVEGMTADNIVTNPPFNLAKPFVLRALELARHKVATIFPTARLNAARWLEGLPLARVWLLTPRPSMPPGRLVLAGEKPQGGKTDFCWLVFDRKQVGGVTLRWLHRDREPQDA
jgi:hypothetical protein